MARKAFWLASFDNGYPKMITFFTTTKPFSDHIGMIQKNAIESWKRICPQCEIIVFDNEEGTEEAARELGVQHFPEVKKNKYGTPLINDIFEKAQEIAKNNVLAYVNADIILLSDFLKATEKIGFERFLAVGRRKDLNIKTRIDFKRDYQKNLLEEAGKEGKLHGFSGIDYFIFTKGVFGEIPQFAIGRTSWDNWLLYKAWSSGAPLIDATSSITAIHQNHALHTPKKQKFNVWKSPEAKRNQELSGREDHLFTIKDADYFLREAGPKKKRLSFYLLFSFSFRYFEKSAKWCKILLFPGWLFLILQRKLKRLLAS